MAGIIPSKTTTSGSKKVPPDGGGTWPRRSALARLEPRIGLVYDVNSPLAADDAAVLVTLLKRLEGIDDLHAGHAISVGCSEGAEPKAADPRCQCCFAEFVAYMIDSTMYYDSSNWTDVSRAVPSCESMVDLTSFVRPSMTESLPRPAAAAVLPVFFG